MNDRSTTRRRVALELSDELLGDIELGRIPPMDVARVKAG